MSEAFTRKNHRRIAEILAALRPQLLSDCRCLFGGGTAIALMYGEFRESVDVDFLVSDKEGYRELRKLATDSGITSLLKPEQHHIQQAKSVRADQYGIRTALKIADISIKFEIVLEGRIELELASPNRSICGIKALSECDMVASKLLANSDRWRDQAVFSRDIIDLAMMRPADKSLEAGFIKATAAYGASIGNDVEKAVHWIADSESWLKECHRHLQINVPLAVVWKQIKTLQKRLADL